MFLRLCVVIILMLSITNNVWACDSCSISRTGREDGGVHADHDHRWFAEYLYENQNWHEKEAGEAHALHHQGHHVHDKTTEEYHHLTVGNHINDRLTLSARLPYVRRHSIDIENHATLGRSLTSEGIGDVQLTGDYQVWQRQDASLSALLGVKLPTGLTIQKDPSGARFEPELQPGSGSADYLFGGAYRKAWDRTAMTANLVYVNKTEGAQNYKFGDVVSTSVVADYLLNPGSRFEARAGLDLNLQYEEHHEDQARKVGDSGGTTILAGPVFNVVGDDVSVQASVLAPVLQDLGGVHQTLDYAWTAGASVKW